MSWSGISTRGPVGRVMRLMTSDEYKAYPDAILSASGRRVEPPRTGRRGRPRKAFLEIPPDVRYATVPNITAQVMKAYSVRRVIRPSLAHPV